MKRLKQLLSGKKQALLNAIDVVFRFNGSIADTDKRAIIAELQRGKPIQIDKNHNVTCLCVIMRPTERSFD